MKLKEQILSLAADYFRGLINESRFDELLRSLEEILQEEGKEPRDVFLQVLSERDEEGESVFDLCLAQIKRQDDEVQACLRASIEELHFSQSAINHAVGTLNPILIARFSDLTSKRIVQNQLEELQNQITAFIESRNRPSLEILQRFSHTLQNKIADLLNNYKNDETVITKTSKNKIKNELAEFLASIQLSLLRGDKQGFDAKLTYLRRQLLFITLNNGALAELKSRIVCSKIPQLQQLFEKLIHSYQLKHSFAVKYFVRQVKELRRLLDRPGGFSSLSTAAASDCTLRIAEIKKELPTAIRYKANPLYHLNDNGLALADVINDILKSHEALYDKQLECLNWGLDWCIKVQDKAGDLSDDLVDLHDLLQHLIVPVNLHEEFSDWFYHNGVSSELAHFLLKIRMDDKEAEELERLTAVMNLKPEERKDQFFDSTGKLKEASLSAARDAGIVTSLTTLRYGALTVSSSDEDKASFLCQAKASDSHDERQRYVSLFRLERLLANFVVNRLDREERLWLLGRRNTEVIREKFGIAELLPSAWVGFFLPATKALSRTLESYPIYLTKNGFFVNDDISVCTSRSVSPETPAIVVTTG